jgi:hypothetical protein
VILIAASAVGRSVPKPLQRSETESVMPGTSQRDVPESESLSAAASVL